MQTHTVLGEQMLGGVAILHGAGLRGRALAPRALGREGLSGRDARGGAAGRRARLRRRRCAGRDDERPTVPPRRALVSARATRSSRSPASSSIPRSSTRSARASRSCATCGASFPPRRTCPVPATVPSRRTGSPSSHAIRDESVTLPSRWLAPAVAPPASRRLDRRRRIARACPRGRLRGSPR